MKEYFLKLALGRTVHSTYFLLALMVICPWAFFTNSEWLDQLAFSMLIVIGLFIFITGWVTFNEAKASHHWPSVKSELDWIGLKSHRSSNSTSYAPDIRCFFDVKGVIYQGTEYDFGANFTSKSKAEAKKKEVEEMSPLVIRYKPNDPSINVIYPGVHLVHFVRLLMGPIVMGVSLASLLGYIVWGVKF